MGDKPDNINYKIAKFPLDKLKEDRLVHIIGSRGSGKTILLYYILSYIRKKFDAGCAMSPTPESLDLFKKFLPESCVHKGFKPKKIESLVESVRSLNFQGKYRRVFIILDDCMYDKAALKGDFIRDIFMNGRHLKIFIINIVQYVMDIPKSLRTQIDYIFACREVSISIKKNLYDAFFTIIPTFDEFRVLMDNLTDDHGVIVIDKTIKSKNPEDCIFFIKAPLECVKEVEEKTVDKTFYMGNRNYWKLHHMFYTPPKIVTNIGNPIPALAQNSKNKNGSNNQQHDNNKNKKSTTTKKPSKNKIITVEKIDDDNVLAKFN
jgi:hypothetical protein